MYWQSANSLARPRGDDYGLHWPGEMVSASFKSYYTQAVEKKTVVRFTPRTNYPRSLLNKVSKISKD